MYCLWENNLITGCETTASASTIWAVNNQVTIILVDTIFYNITKCWKHGNTFMSCKTRLLVDTLKAHLSQWCIWINTGRAHACKKKLLLNKIKRAIINSGCLTRITQSKQSLKGSLKEQWRREFKPLVTVFVCFLKVLFMGSIYRTVIYN